MTLEEFRNRRYITHSLHGLQLENIMTAQRWGDSVSAWINVDSQHAAGWAMLAAHWTMLAFPELRECD